MECLLKQNSIIVASPPHRFSCPPLKLKQESSEDEALGADEDPEIPESLNEMVAAEVAANPDDEANQPEILAAAFPDDPQPQEEGDQEVEMSDGHAVPEERKANGVKIMGLVFLKQLLWGKQKMRP